MNIVFTTSNDTLSLSARFFVDATPLIGFYAAFNGLCQVDELPCLCSHMKESQQVHVVDPQKTLVISRGP